MAAYLDSNGFLCSCMPNFRCSNQTDNTECRQKLLSDCVKMLSDKFPLPPEKKITSDWENLYKKLYEERFNNINLCS